MWKRVTIFSLFLAVVFVTYSWATYKPGGDTITKDGRTSQFVASGFTETTTVHMDVQNISSQTAYMLIDLSDTTNWAHSNTGHVNIEYIVLEIDPSTGTTFLGEVKLGFLENVDATNGDFVQFLDVDMARSSALLVETINFGSHGFDCQSDHHFGPVTANSTLFQTDVNLGGPDDPTTITYPSGDGDIILLIEPSQGSVDVSITLGYEAAT